MASLYELTAEFEDAVLQLEEAQTDEEVSEALEMLDRLSGEIDNKGEMYARIIRSKKAEVEMYKTEAARLTQCKQTAQRTVDRLTERLLQAMQTTGKTEIATSIGKWKIQNNPWSCEVTDLSAIDPEWLIEQPPTVDKTAMLKHFKATGELLSGVEFKQNVGLRFR